MTTQPRIVVVEDDNIIQMEIQGRLEDLGYQVVGSAATGPEAVERAEMLLPDLILMDIRLRGEMDGIEAAQSIRTHLDIPIIYLTAYADPATLQRAKIAEPYGYLIKPFEERELHSAIEVALYKHRMECRLRESEQWLSTVLTSIGDAVIATNAEGKVAFLNNVATQLIGWDAAAALGQPLNTVWQIDSAQDADWIQALAEVAQHYDPGHIETMLFQPDGTAVPIEYTVAPILETGGQSLVLAFRDITERKQAQRELAHRLAEAQTLREVMLAAASTLDFDEVLERTVLTLQETMGLEFVSFVVPGEDDENLEMHPSQVGFDHDIQQSKIPVSGSIVGRVYQSGEPELVTDVATCPYYYGGVDGIVCELALPVPLIGRVRGVLDLESRYPGAFDATSLGFYMAIAGQLGIALKNAELYQSAARHADELSEALEQLQELDDLKSEFIQNVSHELRMPITLIQGYSTLLANGELGPLNEAQKRAIDVVARRAAMMGDLVEDIVLILMTERGPAMLSAVPMAELMDSVVADFRLRAAEAGLTIVTDVADNVAPAAGIRPDLERVLDNLLGNAVKFTPADGTVNVRLRQDDAHVILQVSDTGIGIPEKELARIFDRFYQIDGSAQRRYGGTGLGLALVKEVVEGCGGTVAVESEVGRGTTFTVRLQAYPAPRDEKPPRHPSLGDAHS